MPKVFITGSARRIGRALAIGFAKKGWDIVLHYNDSENRAILTFEEIKALGVDSIAVKADIRSEMELQNAFKKAVDYFGTIDVLVNNAGIFPEIRTLDEIDLLLWDDVMNTNCRSQYLSSRLFARQAKPGSRIVNISSLGAYQLWKGRLAYNVSKAGVILLTKALARELAPDISVNAICPGAIYLPDDPSIVDTALIPLEKIPMKRYGSTQDIFDAVWFFSTASSYITGQDIVIDGAYSLVT